MALCDAVPRTAFCCRPVFCVDAAQVRGIRTRQQCELFVFLCADGGACGARLRRPWRPRPRDRETASWCAATEYFGRHRPLLAFHRRAVVVSAFAAVDEALIRSTWEAR